MIDLQGHIDLVNNGIEQLTYLICQLGNSYDELSAQKVDLENLANMLDASIFANERLKEQKVKLEAYRKELQSLNATSTDKDSFKKR